MDPFTVTFFTDYLARSKTEQQLTLDQLAERVRTATGGHKDNLPWLKLARFGDRRTDKGSLRHDANVVAVYGCEADYDRGQISIDEAKSLLEKAGVEALVYSSPSHTPDKPRWRVVCVFSTHYPPKERARMLARLNGIFSGVLSAESFTLSQSYYYGRVVDAAGNTIARKKNGRGVDEILPGEYRVELIDGQPLDLCDELDRGAIGRSGGNGGGDNNEFDRGNYTELQELVRRIISGESLHLSVTAIAGKYARKDWPIEACIELVSTAFTAAYQPRYSGRWQECVDCVRDIYRKEAASRRPATSLDEWDAGDDPGLIPPRPWFLSTQFCGGFISSLVSAGGVGKSALRLVQYISLALDRPLTGQHVFRRCRVLLISLEDDHDELQRRIKAVLDHFQIARSELKGWLFCANPKRSKLAELKHKERTTGPLEQQIRDAIARVKPDLIALDPFVKLHDLAENDSGDMNFVCDLLTSIAVDNDKIAIDIPHHVHKGPLTPGDADSGRGSSGIRDAGRLIFTLSVMSEEEARAFNIPAEDRFAYVRLDSAKVNIAARSGNATWFRIVGVKIGNATEMYPSGDEVQVVEPWKPKNIWADLNRANVDAILSRIRLGPEPGNEEYYSAKQQAKNRAAWQVVKGQAPTLSEAQCREVIKTWLKTGLLVEFDYTNSDSKATTGVRVDDTIAAQVLAAHNQQFDWPF